MGIALDASQSSLIAGVSLFLHHTHVENRSQNMEINTEGQKINYPRLRVRLTS